MFTDASAQVANLTDVFVCVNAYNAEGGTMLLDWLVTDEQARGVSSHSFGPDHEAA
ncbi:hypothetical protein GGR95_003467 [Sulfitobacter undariae]|uniref:Uncharacterized protein n=1 Tax=Sulfitobacter undariae TaxID=1563671 RepID=A0A7W6ECR8_9RHOB|nr:hypothetical protein [Sulfitobacter undariae]MBB3995803.1 hypothetical protein [Sulfitobacter undariae]